MNKLFTALLYSSEEISLQAVNELSKHFGEVELETEAYDFDCFTHYYEDEMGKNLRKKFIFFKKLLVKNIEDVKLITIQIEKNYLKNGKRQVNIDPGYINKHEMGLPSTKNTDFRTLLKDGIYNQVIYTYGHGIKEAEKTFPDFRSEEVKNIFAKVFKSLQASD